MPGIALCRLMLLWWVGALIFGEYLGASFALWVPIALKIVRKGKFPHYVMVTHASELKSCQTGKGSKQMYKNLIKIVTKGITI